MKAMTSTVFLLAGLGLLGTATAGPGHWTITGPDGGQSLSIAVDATNASHAVATGRSGIFRTLDAGATWQRHQSGLLPTYAALLRAASNSSRMYVVPNARQLYRGDATGSWEPTGLALPAGEWIREVAIRHDHADDVMVLTYENTLLRSNDGGTSFSSLTTSGIPAGGWIVRISYVSATRLYAVFIPEDAWAEPAQLLRSDDGGVTWATVSDLTVGGAQDADLASVGGQPDRIFVAHGGNVWLSNDAGNTLTACGAPPGGDVGHVMLAMGGASPRIWLGGARGLYLSTDDCANWTARGAGLTSDGMRPDGIASIAVGANHPTDPRIYVGTPSGGLYRSDDDGMSFTQRSNGFTSHNIRALAAHPAAAGHLWAGHGDATTPSGTVWRSTDSAASWHRSNTGLHAMHLRGITVDPTTAGLPGGPHLYGVGSSLWQGSPGGYITDGGIYKSLDGGISWATIDNGLPENLLAGSPSRYIGSVRHAVLDPRSCASPPATGPCSSGPLQTVYVTASGRPNPVSGVYAAARVYKSTDAGANWTASENGLPGLPPLVGDCFTSQIAVPLVIDPATPTTLYLGLSVSYSFDSSCPLPAIENGIFKSTDGGASWVHSSNGLPRIGGPGTSQWSSLALAIAPSQPQTLYASAYHYDANGSMHSRIFRSTDGGANWSERSVGVVGQDIRAVLVDPIDPDLVYAAAAGSSIGSGGVYRSSDGGLTWDSISIGIDGIAVTTLMLDPHDSARLYAGTVSGVAEYTRIPDEDIDGVPSDVESQAPHGGDGNQDGIADALQSHVASILLPNTSTRGNATWLTLWVEPVEGTCTRINNMQVRDPATLPADIARGPLATQYAHGLLQFDLPDCQKARVHARFHDRDYSDPRYSWRNYGPLQPGSTETMAWYGFSGASRSAADTWTLEIDGAARGNWLDNDEVIRFVGGVGFLDLELFSDGFEALEPIR